MAEARSTKLALPPATFGYPHAGNAPGARTAALASALVGPLLWGASAVLLLEPHCRAGGGLRQLGVWVS